VLLQRRAFIPFIRLLERRQTPWRKPQLIRHRDKNPQTIYLNFVLIAHCFAITIYALCLYNCPYVIQAAVRQRLIIIYKTVITCIVSQRCCFGGKYLAVTAIGLPTTASHNMFCVTNLHPSKINCCMSSKQAQFLGKRTLFSVNSGV